ncbi:hypothetical protein Taro_035965 [Colocasia esculenta]|uniref:Uncharacterized protein n=1 Tax=Colocasia esculenta TaxID=4460 RepID=A0A843W0C0_COLES|nr:hypothetical protein [Colocasia esculenta]
MKSLLLSSRLQSLTRASSGEKIRTCFPSSEVGIKLPPI